jgi:hypothetical protein
MQLKNHAPAQARRQIRQLDAQLARRAVGRHHQTIVLCTNAVKEVKQPFFPLFIARHQLHTVDAHQIQVFHAIQNTGTQVQQFLQRQINRRTARGLTGVAGGLQQMGTANPWCPPEVEQQLTFTFGSLLQHCAGQAIGAGQIILKTRIIPQRYA